MLENIKYKLKNYPEIKSFLRSPFRWVINWIKAAYLTLKYVDKYTVFPAIQFNGYVKVKIKKRRNAKFSIKDKLIFEQWLGGDGCTTLTLGDNSNFIIEGEFVLGNNIKVSLAQNSTLLVGGKLSESASGITANSVILVNEYLEIGKDCIIAWDTFLTDCDWHEIVGKEPSMPTKIGNHVWIGVGAKVLKGAIIGMDSIVTSQSVVLQGDYQINSLITGAPAKVVKTGIPQWHREMKSKN